MHTAYTIFLLFSIYCYNMNLCLYFVWFVICNIWIIHIPSISERLNGAKGGSQGTGSGKDFAPSIVYIFYHFGACVVNKAYDIAMQIYNITVLFAIELHDGRAVLGVVPEMEIVGALGHVDDVFSVQGVVGFNTIYRFADAQAIGIVIESCCCAGQVGIAGFISPAAHGEGLGSGAAKIIIRISHLIGIITISE